MKHLQLTGVMPSAQPTSANPSHLGNPFSSCRTISSLSPSRAVSCATTSGSGVPPTSTSISGECGRSGDFAFAFASWTTRAGAGSTLTGGWGGGGGVAVFACDLDADGLGFVAAELAAARSFWSFGACTFCAAEAGGEEGGAGRTDRCLHSFSRMPLMAASSR